MGLNAGIRRLMMHYYFYTVDKLMAIVTYLSKYNENSGRILKEIYDWNQNTLYVCTGYLYSSFFSL